jgi:hypothetical protein
MSIQQIFLGIPRITIPVPESLITWFGDSVYTTPEYTDIEFNWSEN